MSRPECFFSFVRCRRGSFKSSNLRSAEFNGVQILNCIIAETDDRGTVTRAKIAKQPETIKWADGRASFRVVPTFVLDKWGIYLKKERTWETHYKSSN